MADNSLSQYAQDFAHAMALKLRLAREQKQKYTEGLNSKSAPSEPSAEVPNRSRIVQQVVKDHPDLTKEKAEAMMEAFNF